MSMMFLLLTSAMDALTLMFVKRHKDRSAGKPPMTEAERKMLIWCAFMLVRGTPLTEAEAGEIDQLIADVRSPLPKIVWDTPVSGRIVED